MGCAKKSERSVMNWGEGKRVPCSHRSHVASDTPNSAATLLIGSPFDSRQVRSRTAISSCGFDLACVFPPLFTLTSEKVHFRSNRNCVAEIERGRELNAPSLEAPRSALHKNDIKPRPMGACSMRSCAIENSWFSSEIRSRSYAKWLF